MERDRIRVMGRLAALAALGVLAGCAAPGPGPAPPMPPPPPPYVPPPPPPPSPPPPAPAPAPIIGGWRENFSSDYMRETGFVSLVMDGGVGCGGTLVAWDWVLSAAHCVFDDDGNRYHRSRIRILEATSDLSNIGLIQRVAEVVPHPDYDPVSKRNDLVLLRLDREGETEVGPIARLASPGDDADVDERAWVYGFGRTETGYFSRVLMKVDVPIVANQYCQDGYSRTITTRMICAGGGDTDSCNGDSGGPLIVNRNRRPMLVGVVSFGPKPCAEWGVAGVYTRVSSYRTWMTNVMSD